MPRSDQLMRAEQPVPQEAHHRTGVLARERRPGDHPCAPYAPSPAEDAFQVVVTTLRAGSASRCARAAVREVLAAAGVDGDDIGDAEIIVAELAANSETHARGPYEVRVHCLSGIPMWCEVVDGGHDLGHVTAVLARLQQDDDAPGEADDPGRAAGHGEDEGPGRAAGSGPEVVDLAPFSESGRGLLLAHRLSNGHCYAYPTTMSAGGGAGKAVAFALPAPAVAVSGASAPPSP
ncbi:ATP-binding protein [Sphaerisporangium rhizosphaerae]|uniref:ATP-binding protein n=1 Tax=Sphaerisporangium rhizosphaerae TaxID=2269375 RepID=A0ABW2P7K4_9ACTN